MPPEQPAAEVVAEVEAEAEEGVEGVEEVRMYRVGGPPIWRIRRVRVHNEIPEGVSLNQLYPQPTPISRMMGLFGRSFKLHALQKACRRRHR